MHHQIDYAGATDTGKVREVNQDQFLIAELNKSMLVRACSLPMDQRSRLFGSAQGHLLMVADGMGGHAAGERASLLAVDYMIQRLLNSVHWFFRLKEDVEDAFLADLKQLIYDAHEKIIADGREHLKNRGMGTTLTMAYAIWPRLYIVHAGDSRCYLFRRGRSECLTRDHTLARRLVEDGGLRPEDEANSRWSNVLWNVLGGSGGTEVTAEVRRVDLEFGDTILLCSDGLYRYLEIDELAEVLSQFENPDDACCELIRLANERGGEDNVTAVVARFNESTSPEQTRVATTVPLSEFLDSQGGLPSEEDTLPEGIEQDRLDD